MRERADDEVDALVAFETADRQHVITRRTRGELAGQRWRVVERLGGQAVVAGEPRGGVARVGEQPGRFAEDLVVERNQPVAQPDVRLGVPELAVRRVEQIVDRAVLVEQPGHLARVADEIGRKLGRNHRVDALAVGLGQIDQPPGGGLREELALWDTT